jgi:uncharacterized RDD family membrane protein YckC
MFTIIGSDGREYGPVTTSHVIEWIRDGRANLQTKAKLNRENVWKTLGDFTEFNYQPGAVQVAPPVLPVDLPADLASAVDARRWQRLLAATIDGGLKVLCYLPISIPLSRTIMAEALSGRQRTLAEISLLTNEIVTEHLPRALPFFAILVLLQLGLLVWRGQSVGKLLAGLRIVRVSDNALPGFARGFLLRGTVPFMLEQIPVFGLIFWFVDSCFIFRPDQRCLHDLLAGTKVQKA